MEDLNPDSKFLKSKGLDVEVPLFKNIANLRTFTNEDEDDFLITVCGVGGGRSIQAAEKLKKAGYSHIAWLCGGTLGWTTKN